MDLKLDAGRSDHSGDPYLGLIPPVRSILESEGDDRPVGHRAPKPVKMKRLTLDIPEPLHRVIKIAAAQEGVTMAEKLRALLAKYYGVKLESD